MAQFADYEVVAVGRTPAMSAGPTLSEIDGLSFTNLEWADRLNGFGTTTLSVGLDTVADDIKTRLLDLDTLPMELWIYRDGVHVWAGPMVAWDIAEGELNIVAHSLIYYTAYMVHETDETLSADYFAVARNLISDWQGTNFGDYGIDTSAVTTAGTSIDLTLVADEKPNVYDQLVKLSEQSGILDFFVEPDTRVLQLDTKRGSDLTSSVVMDDRMIHSDRVSLNIAAGRFGSEVQVLATSLDGVLLLGDTSTSAIESGFGRSVVIDSVDGLSLQADVDAYAEGVQEQTNHADVESNPQMRAIEDVNVSSFTVGDTVSYQHDPGIGLVTLDRRVVAKNVTVDDVGNELLTPEFQ